MPENMKGTIAMNFLEMAKKKDIDKITVKELAENCNISRQSFYYHFQDIYEVLEWTVGRAIKITVDYSLTAETMEEAMRIFLFMVIDNREVFSKMLDSQRRDLIEKLMMNGMRKFIKEMIRLKAGEKETDLKKYETEIDFCVFGIMGFMLRSTVQKKVDIDILSVQLTKILKKQLSYMLDD